MKQEIYTLINQVVKDNLTEKINSIPLDGKTKVIISNAGNKSQRQRGLQWRWYEDVEKSGIGGKHEDTKNGVHLVSKYKWAIPIFVRDDELFADIHKYFLSKMPNENQWGDYLETFVHTEKFNVSQMAEFLTDFERHYLALGVNLTNPDLFGVKLV